MDKKPKTRCELLAWFLMLKADNIIAPDVDDYLKIIKEFDSLYAHNRSQLVEMLSEEYPSFVGQIE